MTTINQKEYLKKYLSGGDKKSEKKKKKKDKKEKKKGLVILDSDMGDLKNISHGYGDFDDGPTVAEITYDCEKTRLRDQAKLDDTMWKKLRSDEQKNQKLVPKTSNEDTNKSVENASNKMKSSIPNKQQASHRSRHDSDGSPPMKKRYDSDESPPRSKRYDSDASPPRDKRHDSDESPPRIRGSSNNSSHKKNRYDSDESPPRKKKYDSDESPPRKKKYDSDESPPRKNGIEQENSAKEREFSKMTTREYLAARKKNKLKKNSVEELAQKARESKLQAAAEETHKRLNKGVAQSLQQQKRTQEVVHEMGKSFARSSDDVDYNDYHKSKILSEDPMIEYLAKKKDSDDKGPKLPIYKGSFPPNRFNIRPGYRWDGVDRSNGFENKSLSKQSSDKAVEEDAYKYMCEDL